MIWWISWVCWWVDSGNAIMPKMTLLMLWFYSVLFFIVCSDLLGFIFIFYFLFFLCMVNMGFYWGCWSIYKIINRYGCSMWVFIVSLKFCCVVRNLQVIQHQWHQQHHKGQGHNPGRGIQLLVQDPGQGQNPG